MADPENAAAARQTQPDQAQTTGDAGQRSLVDAANLVTDAVVIGGAAWKAGVYLMDAITPTPQAPAPPPPAQSDE